MRWGGGGGGEPQIGTEVCFGNENVVVVVVVVVIVVVAIIAIKVRVCCWCCLPACEAAVRGGRAGRKEGRQTGRQGRQACPYASYVLGCCRPEVVLLLLLLLLYIPLLGYIPSHSSPTKPSPLLARHRRFWQSSICAYSLILRSLALLIIIFAFEVARWCCRSRPGSRCAVFARAEFLRAGGSGWCRVVFSGSVVAVLR